MTNDKWTELTLITVLAIGVVGLFLIRNYVASCTKCASSLPGIPKLSEGMSTWEYETRKITGKITAQINALLAISNELQILVQRLPPTPGAFDTQASVIQLSNTSAAITSVYTKVAAESSTLLSLASVCSNLFIKLALENAGNALGNHYVRLTDADTAVMGCGQMLRDQRFKEVAGILSGVSEEILRISNEETNLVMNVTAILGAPA
jgi:hypothetical protein